MLILFELCVSATDLGTDTWYTEDPKIRGPTLLLLELAQKLSALLYIFYKWSLTWISLNFEHLFWKIDRHQGQWLGQRLRRSQRSTVTTTTGDHRAAPSSTDAIDANLSVENAELAS
jgi:hypothetical protein